MVGSCGGAHVDDDIEVEEVWVRTTGDTGVVETGEAGPEPNRRLVDEKRRDGKRRVDENCRVGQNMRIIAR